MITIEELLERELANVEDMDGFVDISIVAPSIVGLSVINSLWIVSFVFESDIDTDAVEWGNDNDGLSVELTILVGGIYVEDVATIEVVTGDGSGVVCCTEVDSKTDVVTLSLEIVEDIFTGIEVEEETNSDVEFSFNSTEF